MTQSSDLHDLRHLVAGDFDYFLKIRVGGMEDFNRINGEQQTRTFFVMKEVGAAGVLSGPRRHETCSATRSAATTPRSLSSGRIAITEIRPRPTPIMT